MFHSSAGFWEFLSPSVGVLPFVPSAWGWSCPHCAVPKLMLWRSIWYWRSSTSDPGSRRTPRFNALLKKWMGGKRAGLVEKCSRRNTSVIKVLLFQYSRIGHASLSHTQTPFFTSIGLKADSHDCIFQGADALYLRANMQSPSLWNISSYFGKKSTVQA